MLLQISYIYIMSLDIEMAIIVLFQLYNIHRHEIMLHYKKHITTIHEGCIVPEEFKVKDEIKSYDTIQE